MAINIEPEFEKHLRALKVLTKFKQEANPLILTHTSVNSSFEFAKTQDGTDFWWNISVKIRHLNLNKEDKA